MPFAHIPVFVRANSIYVTGLAPVIGNERAWLKAASPALVVHATPGQAGESTSFEFVDSQDKNHSKIIELAHTADAITLKAPALSAPVEVEVYCSATPTATLHGQNAAMAYDPGTHLASVSIPAGDPVDLQLRLVPPVSP